MTASVFILAAVFSSHAMTGTGTRSGALVPHVAFGLPVSADLAIVRDGVTVGTVHSLETGTALFAAPGAGLFRLLPVTAPADATPPAAISDLRVVSAGSTWVELAWSSPGDDGTAGTAFLFDVRASGVPLDLGAWGGAARAQGEPRPGAPGSSRSFVFFVPLELPAFFAIRTADERLNWSGLSNVVQGGTR